MRTGSYLFFFRISLLLFSLRLNLCEPFRAAPRPRCAWAFMLGLSTEVTNLDWGKHASGRGVALAQRIVSCGDAGHILVSESAADLLRHLSSWAEHLHELGACEIGSGQPFRLYNLFTAEVGNPHAPERLRSSSGPAKVRDDREPNAGRLVPKLCDQRTQEDEFKTCFSSKIAASPGIPQIYVLHGLEGECHESLVERLVHEVERYAHFRHGDRRVF